MNKPTLPNSATRSKGSASISKTSTSSRRRRRAIKTKENSDVLVSAVISSYLLTHLHHVLQRAEYCAAQEGRLSQSANFAQLRKVLCMDARSMEDASAVGMMDGDLDKFNDAKMRSKAA